jgi:hypothetical protein
MEPEGSLPCSQQPTTGPYPHPDTHSEHLHTLFPKVCQKTWRILKF